jgi:hypothetical protein
VQLASTGGTGSASRVLACDRGHRDPDRPDTP